MKQHRLKIFLALLALTITLAWLFSRKSFSHEVIKTESGYALKSSLVTVRTGLRSGGVSMTTSLHNYSISSDGEFSLDPDEIARQKKIHEKELKELSIQMPPVLKKIR